MRAEYIQHMGSDITVVNAARVSFDLEPTDRIDAKSIGLIRFLAKGMKTDDWNNLIDVLSTETDKSKIENILKEYKRTPTHWTPFGHETITLRETLPVFVARQRFKHKVGFVENEISRRYRIGDVNFHQPIMWRKAADDKKQGSLNVGIEELNISGVNYSIDSAYDDFLRNAEMLYTSMIDAGVCPEQARMVLPQSMMTSYYVTGTLYAFASLYNTRSRPDAQKEIQELASAIDNIIAPLYPVSWKELTQ